VTSPRSNPLQVAARVAAALDDLGVKYSIGGSLARSFSGEPRSTLDVDMDAAVCFCLFFGKNLTFSCVLAMR
jgi:hypothetical protein